jgi:hypothetical protein
MARTVSPEGLAPTRSLTLFPSLNTKKVGICNDRVNYGRNLESGNTDSTDANFLRNTRLLIDVDFVEIYILGALGELLEDR